MLRVNILAVVTGWDLLDMNNNEYSNNKTNPKCDDPGTDASNTIHAGNFLTSCRGKIELKM